MPRLTGGQAVVESLRVHGVDTVFGIPGVHTLPLYDALLDAPEIRHVLARHEQGVGFMADGYARVSGKVGVASVITGPGVTNIATPVADAYSDDVPLLVIASSLPRSSKGRMRGELHEVKDQHGVMVSLAGWTRVVEHIEEIPGALNDAFRALSVGRPRGAYIEIPLDLLMLEADLDIPQPYTVAPLAPKAAEIEAAAKLLREARRPLIIAGNGVSASEANAQLAQLAELLGAPVMLDSKSHDALPTDHPLAFPVSGYAYTREMRTLIADSDVALVIDSRFGAGRPGFDKLQLPSTIIQVDQEPSEVGRLFPVTQGIVANAGLTLDALLSALQDSSREAVRKTDARTEEVAQIKQTLYERMRQTYGDNLNLLEAVREATPREGIIVADMTRLGYASNEYMTLYEPRTYIHPAELCPIGCGLPLALGAKVAAPGRPVVALCGDGGFLLNAGELATAAQEQLGVVIALFNDATYTAVKAQQQRRYQGRYIATDLRPPDYGALARAFGLHATLANTPAQLGEAVSEALQRGGPALIEVRLPEVRW